MSYIGPGNWNPLGVNLPEFELSEMFGGKKGSLTQASNNYNYMKGVSRPTSSLTSYGQNRISYYRKNPNDFTNKVLNNSYSNSGVGSSSSSLGGSVSRQIKDLKNGISNGWDSYIKGLDSMFNGLNGQRSAQEGIVNDQYNQGVNNLGLQLAQGKQDLQANRDSATQNQANNVRDISRSVANAFQAGNVYLGTKGASDSSAANQYSYALNKEGTQQRSGVMQDTAKILADINSKETNLNNIYNSEMNNLASLRDQGIQQVAQWFADAQNKVRDMQNQGRLNKSQDLNNLSKDLLNTAISQASQLDNYINSRKGALDSWASTVLGSINDARSSMSDQSQVSYNLPQAQGISGTPQMDAQGNMALNFGGGGNSLFNNEQDRNNLFGYNGYYA